MPGSASVGRLELLSSGQLAGVVIAHSSSDLAAADMYWLTSPVGTLQNWLKAILSGSPICQNLCLQDLSLLFVPSLALLHLLGMPGSFVFYELLGLLQL